MSDPYPRRLRRCLESTLDNINRALHGELVDAEKQMFKPDALANAIHHIECARRAVSAHFERMGIEPGSAKQELKEQEKKE